MFTPALLLPPISGTPTTISGLQLWTRSDAGVIRSGAGVVTGWEDQSGNRRRLTSTAGPSLVSGLVNGHAALRFDGVDDVMSTASFAVAQPFTVFLVVKQVSITAADVIAHLNSVQSNASPQIRQNTGPIAQIVSNSLVGGAITVNTTSFALLKAGFAGTSSVISINGGADVTDADNLTGDLNQVFLGGRSVTVFSNIEVAELAIYNTTVSGANLTAFNSYVSGRYAIF